MKTEYRLHVEHEYLSIRSTDNGQYKLSCPSGYMIVSAENLKVIGELIKQALELEAVKQP